MNETRVYTFTGKVAHLLAPSKSPNAGGSALRGRTPVWHDAWHGTGSQTEYEKAAALPTCRDCTGRVTP